VFMEDYDYKVRGKTKRIKKRKTGRCK